MANKKTSANKIDESLANIWQLYNDNKIEPAKTLAEQIVKSFTDNAELNYLLGLIYYDKNDFSTALNWLNKAKKLAKETKLRGYIDYWIGITYEFDTWDASIVNPVFDKKKALLSYKSAKEQSSFPADTILKLVQYSDDDYERINLYQFGIEKFPKLVDFYIRLSQLHQRMGYPSKQFQCLSKGEEAEIKSSSLFFNLANYFYDIKDYHKSKEYYIKSLEVNENPRALYCLYYVIGNCYLKLKEYSLAIDYYKKSIDGSTNDASSWFPILGLTVAYYKIKKNSEIIKLFDNLILDKELFEDISFGYVMMTYLDSEIMEDIPFKEDLNEVLVILKKINWETKAKELQLKILLLYEAIYNHLDNHKERLISIRKSLNFNTNYSFIEDRLEVAYLSFIKKTDNLNDVIIWFIQDHSLIANSAIPQILSPLIDKLSKQKSYKEIVELCKNLGLQSLANATVLFEYAYALKIEGKLSEAKNIYEKSIEINPKSTASLNNLGVLFEEEENYERAASLYKQAIRFDNKEELYQNNLKRAKELLLKKQKEKKLKKIPENWLTAIKSFNVDNFEEIEYFLILEKVEKINKKYRTLIERDFKELVFNYVVKNYKSIIVLSGSLVELILTYFCEKNKIKTIPIKNSKGVTVNKKLYDCVLSELILFVDSKNLFGNDFQHLSNLSRIYRNFIHPGLEIKNKDDIKSKGDLCFISTKEILKKILNY